MTFMKALGFIGPVTLILACAPLSATPVYSVTDVGSLGGNVTALGINDNGDIVGTSQLTPDGSSPLHAFLYHHASRSMVDLGTPGGSSSEAFSINDSGTIAGEVYAPDPKRGTTWDPVVWLTSGGSQPLKGPYPNGNGLYVSPNGISNTGVIVGQGYINDVGGDRAIWYKNGTIANLGTLGGNSSFAAAISTQGTYFAGMSELKGATAATNGLPTHAFLYINGIRTDLGALAGGNYNYSAATGVNNNGTVVGYSWLGQSGQCTPSPYTPVIQHAFVTVNGKMTDIGNLANNTNCSSTAEAINDTGEIVGRSDAITTDNVQVERAFLYSGGQMSSLTFLDWGDPAWGNVRFTDAVGINCNGWIAAMGFDSRTPNAGRVYLLIPQGPLRPQCPPPK
jgi:probable HAF family extracellular repeat protein